MSTPFNFWDRAFEVWDKIGTEENLCVIAGGAARDMILDRPIKDLDMIVNLKLLGLHKGLVEATSTWQETTKDMKKLSKEESSVYASGASKFQVHESEDRKLQLISGVLNPLDFISHSFDFGLCFAAITAEGVLLVHDWFLEDLKNKTLTLHVRPTMTKLQIGHALTDHLPRIQAKYPEYGLKVVCHSDKNNGAWHKYTEII